MKFLLYNLGVALIQLTIFTSISLPKIGHAEMLDNKVSAPPLTLRQSDQVKRIIKQYLQENPEIILDSVQKLRERQRTSLTDKSCRI